MSKLINRLIEYIKSQWNRSVFPVDYETELCMKEEYNITFKYWVYENNGINEYVMCGENKIWLWIFFEHYFLITSEICKNICTTCILVDSRIAS
jgi:hypothetical protein